VKRGQWAACTDLRSLHADDCYIEESQSPAGTSLTAPWCNWLTRRPLKAKSSGSIPDGATKLSKSLKIRPKTNAGAALCASLRTLIIHGRTSLCTQKWAETGSTGSRDFWDRISARLRCGNQMINTIGGRWVVAHKNLTLILGAGRMERVLPFMTPNTTTVSPMIVNLLVNRKTLLISTEVMAILRTTKNTLCKWVRENGLPATKMPDNSYRFDPVELLNWWQNRQV
jgi:Helix-turn-helix domain